MSEWWLRKATCLELLAQLEVSSVGESPPVKFLLTLQSPGGPGEPCKFPCILNLVISFYELPSTLQEGTFQCRRDGCRIVPKSKVYPGIFFTYLCFHWPFLVTSALGRVPWRKAQRPSSFSVSPDKGSWFESRFIIGKESLSVILLVAACHWLVLLAFSVFGEIYLCLCFYHY